MFCGKCGSKLEEGAKFCGKCGTPVDVPISTNPDNKTPVAEVTPAQEINQISELQQESLEESIRGVIEEPAKEAIEEPQKETIRESVGNSFNEIKKLESVPEISHPETGNGMGVLIAVLVVLIVVVLGISGFLAYKYFVNDDDTSKQCTHRDKDEDGFCDKCDEEMPDGESEDPQPGPDNSSAEDVVIPALENKLKEIENEYDFDPDMTYYAEADGKWADDASAGSPDGVIGVVWSDIRDCDHDGQSELLVLNILPTNSNKDVRVYKFQVYEVDKNGNVTCEDKKFYELEKYQIYTFEHVLYQADDAVYVIARQHRYKLDDEGKESYYMTVLKYDGKGEMEKLDSEKDNVGPDDFKELFDKIGMKETASDFSKRYEINYDDDIEEINFMRARPAGYLDDPYGVSDMQYDFYKIKKDMEKGYMEDKDVDPHIPM